MSQVKVTNKRRTNLREIAQKLGISASTVSRALRELPGIHPETRERVFEAAQNLGYRGGELLNQKRCSNILTLTQGIGHDTDHEYMAGMSSSAVSLNMSLISHHYRPEECANVLLPEFQPRALTSGQVDGIVLIHRWPLEVASVLREKFPVVSIIHDYPGTDVDVVSLDDRGGMDLVVGHLIAVGYKRIGFFGLCAEMTWSRSRFAGFVDATIQHGREFRPKDVIGITLEEALAETKFHDGTAMPRAADLSRDGVDAWVCSSEMTARSLYEHFAQSGFKIPRSVGITGFHCSRSSGPNPNVVITSTEAPSAELGSSALRRLVHRIEGTDASRRFILLPCSFRKGTTTRQAR
ncbi:MAG: LacI family DNA-binding transcriptional regulator [Terrimicrobiaceae bacterium]